MRAFIICLLTSLLVFGLFSTDVNAKRFGSGRSFGITRPVSSYQYSRPAMSKPYGQRPLQQRNWFGPVMGLLAGGLLASLFFQHGMGSAMLTWLAVAGVIYLLLGLLRRRQPAQASMGQYMSHAMSDYHQQPVAHTGRMAPSALMAFDEAGFLREAKALFIRLQTAYDQKNLTDLRQFTSPQVFAEIQLQLQERGDAANITEVVSLDASLLNVSEEDQAVIASVKFDASLREEVGGAAIAVIEIWHFQKILPSPEWVVAGIQQS